MKLILSLFFLFSISMYAQEKDRISNSDITFENGRSKIKDILITLKKKDDKPATFKVKVNCSDSIYLASKMDEKKLNNMMLDAYYEAMYSCKNKYTFDPKELSIFYNSKSTLWFLSFEFTAQNDYGATKDGTSYTYFDANGDKKLTDSEFMALTDKSKNVQTKSESAKETSDERRKRKRAEYDQKHQDN